MIFKRKSRRLSICAGVAFSGIACGWAEELPDENTRIVFERPPVRAAAERDSSWLRVPLARFLAKRDMFGLTGVRQIIDERQQWAAPSTRHEVVVTVAFNGGNLNLHKQIADLAALWVEQANLRLDFGWDAAANTFRSWRELDTKDHPPAHIRVGFRKGGGYWSLIGRQAETAADRNQATLNLDGFDERLPPNWRHIVLHEFGHALGLRHELQHPQQQCNLRWENDPGYTYRENVYGTAIPDGAGRRPGVYTVFGSAPNGWGRAEVDTNLSVIRDVTGLKITDFDRESVMLYPLERWLFASPESPCVSLDKTNLSRRDVAAIATLYPKEPKAKAKESEDGTRLEKAVRTYERESNR